MEKQQEYQEKLAKQHFHKIDVTLQLEVEDLLVMLMSRLSLPHSHKLMRTLEVFTKTDTPSSTIQDRSGEGRNDTNSNS